MNIHYNYLIGAEEKLPTSYNYKNRPDPDLNGCKKLYDDIIEAYLMDGIIKDKSEVMNKEQQFRYNKEKDKVNNKELWKRYFELNNDRPKEESPINKPPFYTIVYKNFLLSSDYIGPSIYWAEQKGLTREQIIDILNNCRTIGGHIIWPRGCGITINQARGGEETFYDRIDWTLYLIKLFCDNDFNYEKVLDICVDEFEKEYIYSIKKVLNSINAYKEWFKEFGTSSSSFENFCKQFRLKESFVKENLDIIWLASPIPILPDDYIEFVNNNIDAIKKRNVSLL